MLLQLRQFAMCLGLALLLGAAPAKSQAVHSNVVVDNNPAVFAMLAALNAAGYRTGLSANAANTPIRREVLQQSLAHPTPALAQLRAFYQSHRLANPAQDLARYVTLALFLGNPPGLALSLPVSALPPAAAAVAGILPLLQDFWQQANMDAVWKQIQPADTQALQQDSTAVRAMLRQVNAYFRIPEAYGAGQYFIFPDAMIAPGESDALSYQDNYYLVTNVHVQGAMHQVRHTYLHFLLDPLIAQFPAAIAPVDQQILPLVARAPALNAQFKHNATLLYTECLVRALEIQLDPGTAAQKSAAVKQAMRDGLVLTGAWVTQLAQFQSDPADFAEFYPQAAFGLPISVVAGSIKHQQFSPAASALAAAAAEPVRAPSPLELARQRFDAHDLATAERLANAVLQQKASDHASAYYLLGEIAALHNQPQAAMRNFQSALAAAQPEQHHVRTWANMYLGRLYDAERDRPHAVAHYRAALATADTASAKELARAGIKAPFLPPGAKN
ncbi:MAG: hypothetical protein ACRD1Y_00625 [Terriglobales bacterium]